MTLCAGESSDNIRGKRVKRFAATKTWEEKQSDGLWFGGGWTVDRGAPGLAWLPGPFYNYTFLCRASYRRAAPHNVSPLTPGCRTPFTPYKQASTLSVIAPQGLLPVLLEVTACLTENKYNGPPSNFGHRNRHLLDNKRSHGMTPLSYLLFLPTIHHLYL